MKTYRLMTVPMALLLASCGGGGGDEPAPAVSEDDVATQDGTAPVPPGTDVTSPTVPPAASPPQESESEAGPEPEEEPERPTAAPTPDDQTETPQGADAPPAGAPEEPISEPDEESEPEPPAQGPTTPTDGPSTPDPTTPNRVRLDVQITVPAYVSNQLRVDLFWNERRIQARWVGDEFWTATAELPADEERLLVVEFYDGNGAITLGRFEAPYRTGTNGGQSLAVDAEDFDTASFDDDSDGVSNLDELRAGTDPEVADDPGRPASADVQDVIGFVSEMDDGSTYFEPQFLELELPVVDREEVFVDDLPNTSETTVTEVDFSADGNGTFVERYDFFIASDKDYYRESRGTRVRQGDTVRWSGTEVRDGGSYVDRLEVTFDVTTRLDDGVLSQRGEGFATMDYDIFVGDLDVVGYAYEVVLDLDSRDEDDTCTALSGRLSQTVDLDQAIDLENTREATRASADEPWTWSGTENGTPVGGRAERVRNRFYCGFRF